MAILVAYLQAPGEEYEAAAQRFNDSLTQHKAGMPFSLLTVAKTGVNHALSCVPDGCGMSYVIEHPNEGMDIQSLLTVAREECDDFEWLVWFGSWSRILHDDWLTYLHTHISRPGVGAVAATGSWESGVSGQFPNPHLRTSGLMINPRRLQGFGDVSDRRGCYEFEHGTHSLYHTLRRKAQDCLVVGANGCAYKSHEWPFSATYRHKNQENLLIADRQTDAYADASPEHRLELARMAGWEPA